MCADLGSSSACKEDRVTLYPTFQDSMLLTRKQIKQLKDSRQYSVPDVVKCDVEGKGGDVTTWIHVVEVKYCRDSGPSERADAALHSTVLCWMRSRA